MWKRIRAWQRKRQAKRTAKYVKRMVKREAKRIKREGNTRQQVLAAHMWHATRLTALD